MTPQEEDRVVIDGSSFSDIKLLEDSKVKTGNIWTFLTQTIPQHPWIAAVVAIVGAVWLSADPSPSVPIAEIVGITLITVASTWKWRSYERSETPRKLDHVRTDKIEDRGFEGETRQRLFIGSDPPIG